MTTNWAEMIRDTRRWDEMRRWDKMVNESDILRIKKLRASKSKRCQEKEMKRKVDVRQWRCQENLFATHRGLSDILWTHYVFFLTISPWVAISETSSPGLAGLPGYLDRNKCGATTHTLDHFRSSLDPISDWRRKMKKVLEMYGDVLCRTLAQPLQLDLLPWDRPPGDWLAGDLVGLV